MHEDRLPPTVADALRYIDQRFAPFDPLFDAEEPVVQRPFRRRRERAAAAAATALIAASLGCGENIPAAQYAADSILVQLEPGASPPSARAVLERDPPIVALAVVSEAGGALLKVPVPPERDAESAARDAAASPGVSFAEPVHVYRQSRVPSDPRFRDLWGLRQIGAPSAWSSTTGERDVVVAVVDDGVALDHPDLAPNLWVNPDEVPSNGEDDDADGIIDDVHGVDFVGTAGGDPGARGGGFHGSHVAGIIGAAGDNQIGIAGMNWKVSLMAVRALGPDGGRSDDLVRAIDYAVEHGARVINASWSGPGRSEALARAIARAARRGVLIVSAAGNEGAARPGFPSTLAEEHVLSVAATTPSDALSSFSNRGALLAAPGVGILSTTSNGGYERYDGTSMASAHVAGLAALLWSAHPHASATEIRRAIVASASPVAGVKAGRVDAQAALLAMRTDSDLPKRLELSTDEVRFSAPAGHSPPPGAVMIGAAGGGATRWTATARREWIRISRSFGMTPSRELIQVDAKDLPEGEHHGDVVFTDEAGGSATLSVSLEIRRDSFVAVRGERCAIRGGILHVRAGSGCVLDAALDASPFRWRLPGGTEVQGSRLYAQFLRRGDYEVRAGSEALAVRIE